MLFSHKNKGFTLIELLVVISIIGLLASIVLVSVNSAREKARDSKRVAELKQISLAIELYATNNDGNYPSWAGSNFCCGDTSRGACQNCPCLGDDWSDEFDGRTANLYNALVGGEYIRLSLDPLNDGSHYYHYVQQGKCYSLCATLETGGTNKICGGIDDANCTWGWGCCGCP